MISSTARPESGPTFDPPLPRQRTPPLRPAPVIRRSTRRWAPALLAWALATSLPAGSGRGAADADEPRAGLSERPEERLNTDRRRAIERGCRWLTTTKQNEGGSFGDNKALVAATALSTLALLAEGSGYGRGPYGTNIKKAIDWLVNLVDPAKRERKNPPGYFYLGQDNSSKMHGQGYATLALACALGTVSTEPRNRDADRIRSALKLAVACCQDAQTVTGGWGYEPVYSTDHEGSVTVTIAQALRAARDAGILVGEEHVKQGLRYLRNSQKLVGRGPAITSAEDDGSFKYSLNMENSSYALTAAAVSSFNLFGEYAGSNKDTLYRIETAIKYIKRRLASTLRDDGRFYHYGHFYAAWAAWQTDGNDPGRAVGETWGDDASSDDIVRSRQFWAPWHRKMYPVLIQAQLDDGRWTPRTDLYAFGDLVPTAFAILTLAIPDELIPIFQR